MKNFNEKGKFLDSEKKNYVGEIGGDRNSIKKKFFLG